MKHSLLLVIFSLLIAVSCVNTETAELSKENSLSAEAVVLSSPNHCSFRTPQLTSEVNTIALTSGQTKTVLLTLTNRAPKRCKDAKYTVQMLGHPSGLISNLPTRLALAPGETSTYSATFTASCSLPTGEYKFVIQMTDASSPLNYSNSTLLVNVTRDFQDLVLLFAAAESITQNSSDVRFILNQRATGKIEYGTMGGPMIFTNEETSFNYSEHVQSIRNLSAGTTYFYKIHATAQNGSSIISNLYSFSTLPVTPTCIRANPTLAINPNNYSGNAGEVFNLNITLKNNNQNCPDTTYNLSYLNFPASFTSTLPASKVLASGASTTFAVSMNSGVAGTHNFQLMALDSSNISYIETQSLSFNLINPAPTCIRANPTLAVTPSSFAGSAGEVFNFNVTLSNNNQNCAEANYNLSYLNLPAGFSSTLPVSRALASGANATISASISSGSAGNYNFQLRAVDNASSANSASKALTFSLTPPIPGNKIYPPTVAHTTAWEPGYNWPTGNLPGYLQVFSDSLTGYPVRRISDATAFGLDPNSQRLKNAYAKNQPWNADGTLVRLSGYPAALLDAETYERLPNWANIPSSAVWSNLDPDKMFGTSSNKFVSYSVATDARTTLRTFSQYEVVELGYGEGNISNDDRYVGLIGKNGNTQYLFVYDILNNSVSSAVNIGTGDIDWFSVSQLGQNAVAAYGPDGSGIYQGVKVYNIDMTNLRHVTDETGHADLGIDVNGKEVFVSRSNTYWHAQGYSIHMTQLDGSGTVGLFPNINGKGIWQLHISARNIKRPGWAYVVEGYYPGNEPAPAEIFAIKLDPQNQGQIQRFGKHHTNPQAGYRHEPHGVPNPDGTKVIFTSNFNHSSLTQYQTGRAWVIEVPQE